MSEASEDTHAPPASDPDSDAAITHSASRFPLLRSKSYSDTHRQKFTGRSLSISSSESEGNPSRTPSRSSAALGLNDRSPDSIVSTDSSSESRSLDLPSPSSDDDRQEEVCVSPLKSAEEEHSHTARPRARQQKVIPSTTSGHNNTKPAKSTRLGTRRLAMSSQPPASAPINGHLVHASSGYNQTPTSTTSQCFLHSRLDDSLATYQRTSRRSDDLKSRPRLTTPPVHDTLTRHLISELSSPSEEVRTPRVVHRQVGPRPNTLSDEDSDGSMTEDGNDSDVEDGEGSSLTRRLAETAVSVRQMAKQLGRARLKSTLNSILIITKARDNHLIKLTRDLAIWIMTEMRTSSREKSSGITVYVDAQLKHSKRFDAAGIQRDHPQLSRPLMRRFSRRSSSSNLPGRQMHMSTGSLTNPPTPAHHARSSGHQRAATTSNTTPAKPEHSLNQEITSPASLMSALSSVSLSSHNSISGKHSVPHKHTRQDSSPAHDGYAEDSEGQLRYWTAEMCTKSPHLFDYVITLGGDGTVLFASWLFQQIVPPIIPFALGSLGFLTNFDYNSYKKVLTTVQNEGARINLRMRFTCTVYRAVEAPEKRRTAVRSGKTGEIYMQDLEYGDWDAIEGSGAHRQSEQEQRTKDKEVLCFSTRPVEQFEVINDLVVDRGPSPYVSLLELFGDEHHMTTVQADGLCVSTPTGSTAYSLSAGGSLVHPESPAILVTPICPHTLSFRPILLPDSMDLRICVPYNSRSTAWASFDGRGRVELRQGDHIKVTASTFPFPTVCADKQSTDWFNSIARTLKWNERQRQKSFVVIEEDRNVAEENDDDDGTYDIDDIHSDVSGPSSPRPSTVDSNSKIENLRLDGNTFSSASLVDTDNRFAQPLPHPPKLSQRHSYQRGNLVNHASRSRASTTVPPIREGEVGDRDDLREPLDRKRTSRPNRMNSPAELEPVLPSRALPTLDDAITRRHSETSAMSSNAVPRAFAVFGDDSSDVSDGGESV